MHGLFTEARSWLDGALALSNVHDVTRQRLLSALARANTPADTVIVFVMVVTAG